MANPNTAWKYVSRWTLVEEQEATDGFGDDLVAELKAKHPDCKVRRFYRTTHRKGYPMKVMWVGAYRPT